MLPEDYKKVKITAELKEVMKKIEKEIGGDFEWEFQDRPTRWGIDRRMVVLLCSFGSGPPRYYGEWPAKVFWRKVRKITWEDFQSFHERITKKIKWLKILPQSEERLKVLERYLGDVNEEYINFFI